MSLLEPSQAQARSSLFLILLSVALAVVIARWLTGDLPLSQNTANAADDPYAANEDRHRHDGALSKIEGRHIPQVADLRAEPANRAPDCSSPNGDLHPSNQ